MIKMLMMVGLGSFAGGILRFLLSRFVQVNSASSFPWGTAAVNLLGCFILGALYGLFDRNLPHTETRLFLTAGLCGGFTTFSTLMNESFLLLKEGNFSAFFLYTLISFAGGLLAIGLGYLAPGKKTWKPGAAHGPPRCFTGELLKWKWTTSRTTLPPPLIPGVAQT